MESLVSWLGRPVTAMMVVAYVVSCIVGNLVYDAVAHSIMTAMGVHISPAVDGSIPIDWGIIPFLVQVVFLEEIAFRGGPLLWALEFSPKMGVVVAVITSIIFGILHGGVPHIFLQGVFGFSLCMLFIKASAGANRLRGFYVSFATHLLFDGLLVLLLLLSGATHL